MESNQSSDNNLQAVVNRNEKVISAEHLNYLYPNGHRMTHQMRWFKGIPVRCLSSDVVDK